MKLNEFDLDLPYYVDQEKVKEIMQERGCPLNEASKIDYESNWKEKRHRFRLETRCISAMFERLFEVVKTENCWKLMVECVEDVKEHRVLNLLGVCTVQIKFDYNSFNSSDDYQKKKKTLWLLMEGIRVIAKTKGWGLEPFEVVYSKIYKADFTNEWVWKKSIKSPDKNFSAEVLCQHGVKYIDISIVWRDKKGTELARQKIISELPDEFAYAKHLGELKWLSHNEVALVSKKGDNMLDAKLELITKS